MREEDAIEIAYNNGYKKGKQEAINEFAEMLRSHYPHSNSVLKRIDCIEKEMLEKLNDRLQ